MPYTLSHPAAVLLLGRPGLDRRTGSAALPLAAAVCGSMAPDVPYYVPMPAGRIPTHSWLGMFTVDVVIGFACYCVWVGLLLAPALWLAPRSVQRRVPPARRAPLRVRLATWRGFALTVACVWLGVFTHLFWDSFTHSGMWATNRWPALSEVVSGHTVYTWLQFATSIIGLLVIGWALVAWWVRTPATNEATTGSAPLRAACAAGLLLFPILATWPLMSAAVRERSLGVSSVEWQEKLIAALLRYTTFLTLGVLAFAVIWHIVSHIRAQLPPSGPGTPPGQARTSHSPSGQTARSTPEPAIMRRQPSQGSWVT